MIQVWTARPVCGRDAVCLPVLFPLQCCWLSRDTRLHTSETNLRSLLELHRRSLKLRLTLCILGDVRAAEPRILDGWTDCQ